MRISLLVLVLMIGCGNKKENKPAAGSEAIPAVAKPAESPPPAEPPAIDAGAALDENAPRPPTPDEIDRCTRLLVVTAPCGVSDDYEFGWIKAKPVKRGEADARKACTVEANVNEEGMSSFPVKLLDADKLAKVEAAAKKDCKALFAALDEVDPRIGPAGNDPSR